MVAGTDVHEARLKLAGEGIPKGAGVGFEMLENTESFGVSQFMENARYQRALEGELARTITSINSVRSARVHLAIPKQSAFIRNRKKATASVTLDLYAGRSIEDSQIAAISHMVAASIPNLEADQVTVIDQNGRLLTSPQTTDDMRMTSTQFEYRQKLEEYYINRIEKILTPILGESGVRAQVSADIDFTVSEQTQESYNPDLPAIRSEQTVEEEMTGSQLAGGVPGSLANQPPAPVAENVTETLPGSTTRKATRNYELDKTISHTRTGAGSVQRLSVAVVVDDGQTVDEDGEIIREPRTQEEIDRISSLVKEAIGFNVQRGDSVNVINASFTIPPEPEELPEPSFFDNPGLWSGLKQVLAIGGVLLLVFGVLRPVLRELVAKGEIVASSRSQMVPGLSQDQLSLANQQELGARSYEDNLNNARTIAAQDPKRVAQVVNNWVSSDGG